MYAVIFTSYRTAGDNGYAEMAEAMDNLAKEQAGYLGIVSARAEIGITISYWESLDAIRAWKQNSEHLFAQKMGREKWYSSYKVQVCKVEKEYGFEEK